MILLFRPRKYSRSNTADVGKPIHFMVHYTDSLEEGEELKKMVASRFNCLEALPHSVHIGHGECYRACAGAVVLLLIRN